MFSVRGIRKKAEKALQAAGAGAKGQRTVDATGLERVDTAGALEILELAGEDPMPRSRPGTRHRPPCSRSSARTCATPTRRITSTGWCTGWRRSAAGTIDFYKQMLNLCAFFGEILVVVVEAILQPKRFRPSAVIQQMYEVWIRALVIVGVLCFLIGVVIAYQGVAAAPPVRRRDLHRRGRRHRHVPRAGRRC